MKRVVLYVILLDCFVRHNCQNKSTSIATTAGSIVPTPTFAFDTDSVRPSAASTGPVETLDDRSLTTTRDEGSFALHPSFAVERTRQSDQLSTPVPVANVPHNILPSRQRVEDDESVFQSRTSEPTTSEPGSSLEIDVIVSDTSPTLAPSARKSASVQDQSCDLETCTPDVFFTQHDLALDTFSHVDSCSTAIFHTESVSVSRMIFPASSTTHETKVSNPRDSQSLPTRFFSDSNDGVNTASAVWATPTITSDLTLNVEPSSSTVTYVSSYVAVTNTEQPPASDHFTTTTASLSFQSPAPPTETPVTGPASETVFPTSAVPSSSFVASSIFSTTNVTAKVEGSSSTEVSTTPTPQPTSATTEATTVLLSASTMSAPSTTTLETTSTPAVSPTTTTAETTAGVYATTESTFATTERMLNTSDVLSDYWVVTVLTVATDENTTSFPFRNEMETSLANLYDLAYTRANNPKNRARRAVTKNEITIQVTNVSRSAGNREMTDVVYYMLTEGSMTEAQAVVDLVEHISIQEMAIEFRREVVVKAKLYNEPEPHPDRKLWIIGVVFGGIIFFVGFCWCILFVYFKCTRPPTKRTPREQRSLRMEVYTNEGGSLTKAGFKPNEVKGFDVVRTEVGLENEIYQKDRRSTEVKEPYRRRDGSTELEGMYSGGDGTPERKIAASVSPPLKNKRIKQISLESEGDTEERQTDMSEDRLPLSPPKMRKPKKAKKKHNRSHRNKGKSQAEGKEAPKPKTRSSIHPVASSSYGNDDDDEAQSPVRVVPPGTMAEDMDDIRRSLKTKTEIERQSNKRRQRSLKSGDLVNDTSDPIEMKRLQREMDSILDPSSAHSSLGTPSPSHEIDDPKDPKHVPLYLENFVLKKKSDSNVWNAYSASDEAANINKQGIPERLKHLSQVSVDSDDNDSLGSGRRAGRVRSAEYPSPRPASQLFAAMHRSSKGKKPFHLPKDDYTSIRLSSNIIAPESKRNISKRDSEQSDSGRYSSDDNNLDSLNGGGPGGSSLQEAYLITDGRTTSLQDGYLVQHVRPTPVLSKSSSVDNPRLDNPTAVQVVMPKPRERVNSSDDEIDAVAIVKAKKDPSPVLVTSMREELQRLAQKSPRPDTSVSKF